MQTKRELYRPASAAGVPGGNIALSSNSGIRNAFSNLLPLSSLLFSLSFFSMFGNPTRECVNVDV